MVRVLRFVRGMNSETPQKIPLFCPYEGCPGHECATRGGPKTGRIVRKGSYYRREDSRWIPRWRCLDCGRSFGSSRLLPCFRQKKRRLNSSVALLLGSGVSLRRTALLLGVNVKTVVRKFLYESAQAKAQRVAELERMRRQGRQFEELQFDEMESFERSKCLPLSIPLVVLPGSRKILDFKVVSMPAKGPLARISLKKYGKRADDREAGARELFESLSPLVHPKCRITTDQNPKYPRWIREHFATVRHKTIKGKRGCVVGQGELKRVVFDPLFSFNHTAAMIRANVNRLFRRTWCTTKRPDRLAAHLELYARLHNSVLTPDVF